MLSASGAHGGGEDSASCWQGDDGASLVITDIGGIACGNQGDGANCSLGRIACSNRDEGAR